MLRKVGANTMQQMMRVKVPRSSPSRIKINAYRLKGLKKKELNKSESNAADYIKDFVDFVRNNVRKSDLIPNVSSSHMIAKQINSNKLLFSSNVKSINIQPMFDNIINMNMNEQYFNWNQSYYPSLSEKITVIQGAATDIGQQTTQLYTNNGAYVYAIDNDSYSLKKLSENNKYCIGLEADCSNENDVEAYMKEIYDKNKAIHILCNMPNTVNDNFKRTLINCKYALQYMNNTVEDAVKYDSSFNGCSIVNSTTDTYEYSDEMDPIMELTELLYKEYCENMIRCNMIKGREMTKNYKQHDIAKIYAWLGSNDSCDVNGEFYCCDQLMEQLDFISQNN
eukprot:102875_1